MNKGTPKTLYDAIDNGLLEIFEPAKSVLNNEEATIIKKHVKDFLAHHFGVAMLANEGDTEVLTNLFKRITE